MENNINAEKAGTVDEVKVAPRPVRRHRRHRRRHRLTVPPPSIPPEEDTYPEVAVERGKRRRWILSYAKTGGVGAAVRRLPRSLRRRDRRVPQAAHALPRRPLDDEWGALQLGRHTRDELQPPDHAASAQRCPGAGSSSSTTTARSTSSSKDVSSSCRGLSEPLDFEYIDTDHLYASTLAQLDAVRAVLAEDGVILGDDWIADPEHIHSGVMRAVNDFIRFRDYQLLAAGPEAQWCVRRTPRYVRRRR